MDITGKEGLSKHFLDFRKNFSIILTLRFVSSRETFAAWEATKLPTPSVTMTKGGKEMAFREDQPHPINKI